MSSSFTPELKRLLLEAGCRFVRNGRWATPGERRGYRNWMAQR